MTYEQFCSEGLNRTMEPGAKLWGRICWDEATRLAVAECKRIVKKDWGPVLDNSINDLVGGLHGVEAALDALRLD